MREDSELLRLRALAQSAEERYLRLKANLEDAVVVAVAKEMWIEAANKVEAHIKQKR